MLVKCFCLLSIYSPRVQVNYIRELGVKKMFLPDLYTMSPVLGYEEVEVTPTYQIVYKGEPAKIECTSFGHEYWTFNGIVVNSSYVQPKSIFIPETLKEHAGTYKCCARLGNNIYQVHAVLEVAGKT